MDVWDNVKRRIFEYAFGNSYSEIYDIIAHRKNCSSLEFELRLADYNEHCSIDNWNIYDDYLIPYTSFTNDVIITYQNPSFDIKGKIYREYKAGNVFQEKSLISKFKTENIDGIPLISKISYERYLPMKDYDIRRNPTSFARTYRQSFRIECSDLSERTAKYLLNWSVDKTIRQISARADDYKIKHEIPLDINAPSVYDILDIEFEYDGDYEDFELSLIALIEFLYLVHPTMSSNYRSVSFEYQLYSILCRDQLESLLIAPEIKHSDSPYCFDIDDGSRLYLMLYINDDNYLLFDKNIIDFGAFQNFDIYRYSVLQVTYVTGRSRSHYVAIDAYYIDNQPIYTSKYMTRYNKLKEKLTDSKIIKVYDFSTSKNENMMKVYMHDNYKLIRLVPVVFHIDLALKPHRDGISYMLYTKDDQPLVSPLLAHQRYLPSKYDGLSTNDNIRFKCVKMPGSIELIPMKNTKNIDSLSDAESIILEAFSRANDIILKNEAVNKSLLYLFQIVIEHYNTLKYKNVLLWSPMQETIAQALHLISCYISYDKLIIKTTTRSVIENLNNYYSNEFIPPIKRETRIVKSSNRRIYTLNEEKELYNIPEVFHGDMNLILTSFYEYKSLAELLNEFIKIKNNVTENGIVVLNYINNNRNAFEFVYDAKLVELTKDITISKLTKADERCLIKRDKKLTTKGVTLITHSDDGSLIYGLKIDEYRAIADDVILCKIEDSIREMISQSFTGDIVLAVIKALSSAYGFNVRVNYPIEDEELSHLIAYNKIINDEFSKNESINYSNYVSVEMIF